MFGSAATCSAGRHNKEVARERCHEELVIGGQETLPHVVTFLIPKIRRGWFIFLAWIGDHSPRHVHVYRDGRLVVERLLRELEEAEEL